MDYVCTLLVEHLPSKQEALRSKCKPQCHKKKKGFGKKKEKLVGWAQNKLKIIPLER
jgi:predicted RNA-binding protein with RPS1 domain